MNIGLLVVERMVLESIYKGSGTIDEVSQDTYLNTMLVSNIMSQFVMKGYVSFKKGRYEINEIKKNEWLENINNSEGVKEEIKEIFSSLVNQYFKEDVSREDYVKSIRLQKICMTSSEEKVFKSLLYNIDLFIKNIQRDRRKYPIKEKTGDQKVIFWGTSNYARLVDSLNNAV